MVKLHANQVSLELLGVLFRLWVKIHVYVLNLDFFFTSSKGSLELF